MSEYSGESMLLANAMSEEYDWSKSCASRHGVLVESREYLNAVRDWRQAWRPERVEILLVAESHVAEHSGDDAIRVQTDLLPPDMPDRFVRLVYGESRICDTAPRKNGGTWQFWELFGALAGSLTKGLKYAADPTEDYAFIGSLTP